MAIVKTLPAIAVASAGTPVRVSSTTIIAEAVWISCPSTNTGAAAYVGDSDVDGPTERGLEIGKGVPVQLTLPEGDSIDLMQLYVDVITDGDQVAVMYLQKRA